MKTLILILIAAAGATAQDSLADALRKGIVAEEVNADLNAAIKAYESVLARFDSERQTAATALFRMAECYRKLGRKEQATAAYTRLVQQFGDQAGLVARSRQYVAAAVRPQPSNVAGPPTPEMQAARKVCREALAQHVEIAKAHMQYMTRRVNLGAVSYLEMYAPRVQLAEAEANLMAFDAGVDLAPLVPAGTQFTGEAGRKYRGYLQTQFDQAALNHKAVKDKYQLGMVEQREVIAAAGKIPEAQCRLAAFDAGWVQRPSLASPVP